MKNFIFCAVAGCHTIPNISSLMSFYDAKSERGIYISETLAIYSLFLSFTLIFALNWYFNVNSKQTI